MTPAEISALEKQIEDFGAFDAAITLALSSEPARLWTDWDQRRSAFNDVYEAMHGARFEPDSNVDELFHAVFRDGWRQALETVAAATGLNAEAVEEALDEIPTPPRAIGRWLSRPLLPNTTEQRTAPNETA